MGVDFRRVGVLELSKFHAGSAGLALEPQQTARVKVTARAAAELLRPSTPNSAEIHTHVPCIYANKQDASADFKPSPKIQPRLFDLILELYCNPSPSLPALPSGSVGSQVCGH